MSDEISTDDLFGEDAPAAPTAAPAPPAAPKVAVQAKVAPPAQPPAESGFDGTLAQLKAVAGTLTTGRLEYIVRHDARKGVRGAAQDELNRRAAPKGDAEPVTIDNAVAIRKLDWRCVCDNTNTHSLTRCGKCNAPRYTTD
jgi:hypothetical protein